MPETLLRPVDALSAGEHACLVYDSDELRRRALEAYLRSGLAAGDKILFLAATESDAELGARVRADALPGQVDVVLADDAYADGGFDGERTLAWFAEAKRAALDGGFNALRAAGGVPPGAYADVDAVVSYERGANALFGDGRMVALCEYDRRAAPEATLLGVLDAHSAATYAVDGDDRLSLDLVEPGVLQLSGWVDVANAGVLAPKLLEAIAGPDDVTLDLRAVLFADVAALRLFAEAARALAAQGRRLRLVAAPPAVPRVLDILGWADLHGLEVV